MEPRETIFLNHTEQLIRAVGEERLSEEGRAQRETGKPKKDPSQ
jgi:hypothetical protein